MKRFSVPSGASPREGSPLSNSLQPLPKNSTVSKPAPGRGEKEREGVGETPGPFKVLGNPSRRNRKGLDTFVGREVPACSTEECGIVYR